ncbi:hypothetical protein [Gimesia algae]|uniref:Uncharacterized protein n=1 Tax=Gimesia algae TaxID=2527971 RepID=A0A517V6C5_9PLAN|nr:hypothetical protein [Gimesia algae]QDT88544.1 hypothetical protein Pan161_01600 [Gimesia algae]
MGQLVVSSGLTAIFQSKQQENISTSRSVRAVESAQKSRSIISQHPDVKRDAGDAASQRWS